MIEMQIKSTEELMRALPIELQQEVRDFVVFLIERQTKKTRRKLQMDWAGALKDWRDQYSSVELQHKASDWMAGEP